MRYKVNEPIVERQRHADAMQGCLLGGRQVSGDKRRVMWSYSTSIKIQVGRNEMETEKISC